MGSLVDDQRLRFDFAYGKGLEPAEVEAIERLANAQVLRNAEVGKELLPIEEAKKKGPWRSSATSTARWCGGLGPRLFRRVLRRHHVDRTGDIGLVKIVSEKAIAPGPPPGGGGGDGGLAQVRHDDVRWPIWPPGWKCPGRGSGRRWTVSSTGPRPWRSRSRN